ncbi:MAG: ABC transporter permease [Candidatus Neomarinimicrobiota bacterium]|nr:ABC transporter permease [Candidatus Neomarinimicrobiota bacterium]RKY51142.1 MAG: ABC transporter permease [Candidatus Neomarinimicrobiota bacterium]
MRRFIGFLKKEFLHIFRDSRTLVFLFGIPVAQLLIFGFVIVNDINNIDVLIVDHSGDEVTQEIIQKLSGNPYFHIISSQNTEPYEDLFKKGTIQEVIVFENNLSRKYFIENTASVQLLADGSEPNKAHLIVNYTQGVLQNYFSKANPDYSNPNFNVRMFFNEELRSPYVFVPGTMALILMLISAMMTSISITREKEMGSMEILLASPMRPVQIIAGKVLPYLFLSVINAGIIICLGYYVFQVPIEGSLILLMAESILFIAMALALGIMISAISPNQMVAMMISMFALMMPTMLLSGFIFPIDSMPVLLQWISAFMPPRWFILILKRIMLKGVNFTYIWKETAIIAGMFIFFLMVSIRKFKIRLE